MCYMSEDKESERHNLTSIHYSELPLLYQGFQLCSGRAKHRVDIKPDFQVALLMINPDFEALI